MNSNANEPAFPALDSNCRDGHSVLELRYAGLTKREYFAAMAMQGLLSAHDAEGNWTGNTTNCARDAVMMADSLLEALSTPSPSKADNK